MVPLWLTKVNVPAAAEPLKQPVMPLGLAPVVLWPLMEPVWVEPLVWAADDPADAGLAELGIEELGVEELGLAGF